MFKHLLRPNTVHIYYISILLSVLCCKFFYIMLFNCFPLFYIYICTDYVLNMYVYSRILTNVVL